MRWYSLAYEVYCYRWQFLSLACHALTFPRLVNVMSTDYDRLSGAVNRPSERPIVADEWSAKADNWLLTADVLSPILCFAVPNPLHNLEHTT